jgi:tetratricopeptide (TPR) repeat protein
VTGDIEALAKAAEQEPEDAWAWLRLARAFLRQGTPVAARHVLDRAIDNALDEAPFYVELGEVLLGLEELDQAGSALRRAAQLAPGETAAEVRLAELLFRQGAYEEGIAGLEAALQRRPRSSELLALLAQGRMQLGHFQAAQAAAEPALQTATPETRGLRRRLLAHIHLAQGNVPEVVALLRLQHAEQLASFADLLDLAAALLKSSSSSEAEALLRTLAEHQGQSSDLELRFAQLTSQCQAIEVALPRLERLARLDPSAPILSALGSALVQAERYLEALAPLRQSLDLTPGAPQALHDLGRALLRLGAHREASTHLVQAASLLPDNDRVRADLAEALVTPSTQQQMGLVGDLSLFTVSDLLQLLSQLRSTGRLDIVTPRGRTVLLLVGGRILDAQNDRIEPMLPALEGLGKEARDRLNQLSPQARSQELELVGAFRDTSPELLRALGQLLLERTLRCLGPELDGRQGQATFTPATSEVEVDPSLLIAVEHAVLEASRRGDEARSQTPTPGTT